MEIWKSRALGLDLWKCGNLELGNLEIWKSRALGLDLWKSRNLEPWGWTFGHLEISWKFGNGGFKTEQLWILGGGASVYVCIYVCVCVCFTIHFAFFCSRFSTLCGFHTQELPSGTVS